MSSPNAHRPTDWKAATPAASPATVTFAAQQNLPRLPVPELWSTLARLKETLKPMAWSDTEYQNVLQKVDAFAAGPGPKLQQRLLQRKESMPHWLEQWWDQMYYLGYRESVVVNTSYYYGFDEHPKHLRQTPAARAAGIARAVMIFRKQLREGTLPPEVFKKETLCMDSYRWMFDCCRIPGLEGLDWSISYAKPADLGNSGHIIVFRKNRVWKVSATHGGHILSTNEFERQIQHIYDNSTGQYPGIGVLTASKRDVWAKDYAELAKSPRNAAILHEIQSAAFVMNLDSSEPTDAIHHSRALWHGDVINGKAIGLHNRWMDKPLQYIIFDNAYAGVMLEHSAMDGTQTTRLCNDVLEMLEDPNFDHGDSPTENIIIPVSFDWEVTPGVMRSIDSANATVLELIESQALSLHLASYGKAAIKEFGVSPDSWAQMIVQLAYRRLIGTQKRIGGTYEAATTRRFSKGRVAAIHVVTSESDAWVESMLDQRATREERKRLFDVAIKNQVGLARAANMGHGVDCHLTGLRHAVEPGEELPALFKDPVLLRSSHWAISTSAIFSKHFPVYGWGEVVPDGFGVAYMTGYEDRLQYTITSRKEMPNTKFCIEIARAAGDLYALHADNGEHCALQE